MSENTAAAPATFDPAALSLALARRQPRGGRPPSFATSATTCTNSSIADSPGSLRRGGSAWRFCWRPCWCGPGGGDGCPIWVVQQAAQADGLRVEPFSVPPDLAANGLTGQVVAARLIDRLSELQSQTNTGRPPRYAYSVRWGDKTIKLEIPETGVSLEDMDSWRAPSRPQNLSFPAR